MGMWLFSSRRLVYYSMVALFIISVFQMWVCCDCRVGAIRILPAGNGMGKITHTQPLKGTAKVDLFRNYFNGRSFSFNTTTPAKGFEDNKRRVPTCPDPLHN